MSCQLVHVFYTTHYFTESVVSHYATQLYMEGEVSEVPNLYIYIYIYIYI